MDASVTSTQELRAFEWMIIRIRRESVMAEYDYRTVPELEILTILPDLTLRLVASAFCLIKRQFRKAILCSKRFEIPLRERQFQNVLFL